MLIEHSGHLLKIVHFEIQLKVINFEIGKNLRKFV